MNHERILSTIPANLRPFCVPQDYSGYTAQDQAVWRYIMRRNMYALREVAHPAYVKGLEQTGIAVNRIPDIEDMNRSLAQLGWKAVVVDGFVPPAAFMEFQQHKILVISAEIRNITNLLYTPAPDIVHEAAGHAPIIAEPEYARFLQKIGEYGAKAIFSKLDYEVYEAIRYLSIIKEYPDASQEEIRTAEDALRDVMERNTDPSEATLLSRLHWWTVEYGLMGSPEKFSLYGAGLLSSVGESKACLDPSVKKIMLSKECVHYAYDITEMQPQLFVARDFQHLMDVLEDFAADMCFRKGGAASVKTLMDTENVGTCELSSGLQISGTFTEMETDISGQVALLRTSGPTQLAFDHEELCCHGTAYHPEGYVTLTGKLAGVEKAPEHFDEGDLYIHGIVQGNSIRLTYESGYKVTGVLKSILRRDGNMVLLTLGDGKILRPDGSAVTRYNEEFLSLAFGAEVTSVFSGSADRVKFDVYPPPSERKTIKRTVTANQQRLYSVYDEIRRLRENQNLTRDLQDLHQRLSSYPNEWLARLELLELALDSENDEIISALNIELDTCSETDREAQELIQFGRELLAKTRLSSIKNA